MTCIKENCRTSFEDGLRKPFTRGAGRDLEQTGTRLLRRTRRKRGLCIQADATTCTGRSISSINNHSYASY